MITEEHKALIRETAREVIEQHQERCPINDVVDCVYGDGTAAKPGMKTRLDRQEQSRSRTNEWTKPLIAGIVSAVGMAVGLWVVNGGLGRLVGGQ